MTNPLGQHTRYAVDALDRVTQLADAVNGLTGFSYDANGYLLTITDRKGRVSAFTYVALNRRTWPSA